MKKTLMMVVTHKKVDIPKLEGYQAIIVGNKNISFDGAIRDNTGDNISEKNRNYCELTAQYWVWKNFIGEHHSYEYIGLSHYRRFLGMDKYNVNSALTQSKISELMKSADVLLPEKFYFDRNCGEVYYVYGAGKKKDLDNVREYISNSCPEYLNAFDKRIMSNNGSYCNMFVMNVGDFCKYNEWLFDILGNIERITDLTGYSASEARIYGYISELLLDVWIATNNLKVRYFPIINTDENYTFVWKDKVLNAFKKYYLNIKFKFSK